MKKWFIVLVILSVYPMVFSQNTISVHQEQLDYYNSLTEQQIKEMHTPAKCVSDSRPSKSCDLTRIIFGYHPYWSNGLETNYNWNLISDFVYCFWEFSPTTGNVTNSTVGQQLLQ
jgi:hypothetical protein